MQKASADHPAVLVNRPDAEAFCIWLTGEERRQGLIGPKTKYRLPTDRDWSHLGGLPDEQGQSPAARDSKAQKHYPWGEIWPPPNDAGNFANPSDSSASAPLWRDKKTAKRRFPQTSPEGSYTPNSYGLYHMAGNGWPTSCDPHSAPATISKLGGVSAGPSGR